MEKVRDNRELDREIAIAYFGWKWWTRTGVKWLAPSDEPEHCEKWEDDPLREVRPEEFDELIPIEQFDKSQAKLLRPLPEFSTDPAASKLLREKLAEKFATWGLHRNKDGTFGYSVSKHGAASSFFAEDQPTPKRWPSH